MPRPRWLNSLKWTRRLLQGHHLLQQEEAGELWDGPVPEPHLGPLDVISLTLLALSRNDIAAQPHAGTALLRRFSTSTFALVGEPQPRQTPRELSAFFASSQYNLFLQQEGVSIAFPSDLVSFGDNDAWQEVVLEDTRSGEMLVKLGWSLVRRSDGCWVTDKISWHDFRPGWRPGLGEVEWDRSFG